MSLSLDNRGGDAAGNGNILKLAEGGDGPVCFIGIEIKSLQMVTPIFPPFYRN